MLAFVLFTPLAVAPGSDAVPQKSPTAVEQPAFQLASL